MASRPFALVLLATVLASAAVGGYVAWRSHRADELVTRARGLLEAPFSEAPELADLEAAEAWELLGRARKMGRSDDRVRGLEDYAEALSQLKRGDRVGAEQQLEAARGRLGWTPDLRVLAAAIERSRDHGSKARAHVDEALEADAKHRHALLSKGDLALDRGDAAAARKAFERLQELEPKVALVSNRIGVAQEMAGQLEKAEASFREAVQLDDAHADAWVNLGRLLRRRDEPKAARDAFAAALDAAPGSTDALFGRGLARMQLGKLGEARDDFERAVELGPGEVGPTVSLGDVARRRGNLDKAIAKYREALRRAEDTVPAWVKLGNALIRQGKPSNAETAFRRALELEPNLAAAHNGLGTALMHQDRPEQATRALERAAGLDPGDPNPLLNLAVLRERAGQTQAARQAFERALERDPSSEFARRHLASL
jgi:tetratricopeptide (TPR) repeat protein